MSTQSHEPAPIDQRGRSSNPWLVVVPARLESQRLPRKPLADLGGKPLIVRVRENLEALKERGCKIVVATDAREVQQVVEGAGYEVCMTRTDHLSGTDRCAEVASQLKNTYDQRFILNVQGDEPFVNTEDLLNLMNAMEGLPITTPMGTLVFGRQNNDSSRKDFNNPNIVKAVRAADGHGIYFSRAPVPHRRDKHIGISSQNTHADSLLFWQHIGVYAFRQSALEEFCALPPSPLELTEKLEQLRAIEAGWRIWLEATANHPTHGIDTIEDLEVARGRFI